MMTETISDIMARVAAEIAKVGVGKTGTNVQQGYRFRPIDEVLNVVGPIMASHGLAMTVKFQDRVAERIQTKSGGSMTSVVLQGDFTFHWHDQAQTTVTIGEAMDSGDKATNKAMAMATKYALVLTFGIPVIGSDDTDAGERLKTLNDPRDQGEIATKMSAQEFYEWKSVMQLAKTRADLRETLRDALAKAQEYGDVYNHTELKRIASERSKVLPDDHTTHS